MTVQLRYVQRFVDRHGRERFYLRKPGCPRLPLPGSPGTPEFMAAYQEGLGKETPPRAAPAPAGGPGSIEQLVRDYLAAPDFLKLKASSQGVTKRILLRFAAKHGHRIAAEMQPIHVTRILGAMSETPAAANNLLKKLRRLLKFGRRHGYLKHDPTADADRYREGTHHTWTDDELRQFERRWPQGTRERTGYALALYTGQRRADLVAMTWHHINLKAGTVLVVQEKTGTELEIPLHRELRAVLESWPRVHMHVLGLADGRGTSAPSFGNQMADAIDEAGLPERCVLHGLRKAAARRLAEAGCTAHQIMAITGHKSLKEVERYTVDAEQKKLAQASIRKLEKLSNRKPKV